MQSIEEGSSILTLGLSVEGEIPEDGLEVFLNSDVDLSNYFNVSSSPFSPGGEVLGAIYDESGAPTGIRLKVTERNAIVNLVLQNQEEPTGDSTEEVTFSLVSAVGYTANPEAETIAATIYDTLTSVPQLPTVPTVGVTISEPNLIESEGNSTTLNFTLSDAPPEEGVLVYIDSGVRSLGQFDVLNAQVEGGAFPAPNFQSSGFYFRIFDQEASITLSAFPDDVEEGVEEYTFELQPGIGYAIDPDANAITVSIADTPDSVPLPPDDGNGDGEPAPTPVSIEPNDTISEATSTELSVDNPVFTVRDAIDATSETRNLIDASEDVDLFAVELGAGDSIAVDVDSIEYNIEGIEYPQRLDSILRVFNEAGDELALNTNAPAPDEVFASNFDPYLQFTADLAGTYYVGVSQFGNNIYDPFVAGSGSGRIFPQSGRNIGEYDLTISLTPANAIA